MFSGRPSVRASIRAYVRPSVRDSRGSFMFPRYLQYLLTDFRQTFVIGASWDTDDLITFLDQKVKVQGHTIAAEAHSTRRCVFCVQLIQNKFSEFQLGIEAGSQRFEHVDKMATALVEEENPKSTLILERQEDLRYILFDIPICCWC